MLTRLILTGFMGSGKSTVGPILADRLGWTFLDLDHEIERRERRTVPQVFAESGEPYFRQLESTTLADLIQHPHTVFALGGGAPENPANRELLAAAPNTAILYLAAPLDHLLARCQTASTNPATLRPVLADPATAAQRFQTRHPVYETLSTHTIDTTHQTPTQTAEAILKTLNLPLSTAPTAKPPRPPR
jgi:shikimate kinase